MGNMLCKIAHTISTECKKTFRIICKPKVEDMGVEEALEWYERGGMTN